MVKKLWLLVVSGIALLLILVCCVGVMLWGGQQLAQRPGDLPLLVPAPQDSTVSSPFPTAVLATPTATIVIQPTPNNLQSGQASPLQSSTEQLLLEANLPIRDQRLLAMRLKHAGKEVPEVVKTTPPAYQMGAPETFWVIDNSQTPPHQFQANVTLQYITPHSYWWVQDGFNVSQADLQRSAEKFETQTYPTNRAFFGSEWSPGVDSDVHVNIFMGNVPGVAGLFSASNSFSRLAEPYSNEREMFYINLKALPPGNTYFDSVLAHEFQHMIHWNQDRNESTWVNEGLSELAPFINGYGSSSFAGVFRNVPDTQLTSWADSPSEAAANYGGSFLFMAYFLQHFGEELTRAMVANPHNGIAGFNATLAEHGRRERFDDIFADFLAANYLNDTRLGQGQWGYKNLTLDPLVITDHYSTFPAESSTEVHQYGGDYFELTGNGDLTIEFTGATQVQVVDNQAHSGKYQWYSHRGDETNTRLTRAFDLRNVTSATLSYWTWYDIEPDWDYGYVEVSTDGGSTWTILQTPYSATTNPSGNAYGPGYTGLSGDGPSWIEERLDLSGYTGREIMVRFEYVTDDAVNRPGWTIDDIHIPEIGFSDDAESGPNGWQAEGFVRMDNILPQHFLVQVLQIGDKVTLKPIPLNAANQGTLTVPGLGSSSNRAVLIVSGLAPVTTQVAPYRFKLTQ